MSYLFSWWKRKLSRDDLLLIVNSATITLYSRLEPRLSNQMERATSITINPRLSDPSSYTIKIETRADYRLDYVFFPSVLKLMLVRYGYAAVVEKGTFNSIPIPGSPQKPSINIVIRPMRLQERKALHTAVQCLRIIAASFFLALASVILWDAARATFL